MRIFFVLQKQRHGCWCDNEAIIGTKCDSGLVEVSGRTSESHQSQRDLGEQDGAKKDM